MEKFLQLIHLKPRSLFGISLVGLFLLFNPKGILNIFGLTEVSNEYRGLIGIITLITMVFFIVELIPWIQSKYSMHKYKKQILDYLNSLSFEESLLLLYCKRKGQQSLSLPITHGTAKSLVSKGIMEQASGSGSMTEWPYTISNIVWKKIKKDESILPHLVSDEELKKYEKVIYNIY